MFAGISTHGGQQGGTRCAHDWRFRRGWLSLQVLLSGTTAQAVRNARTRQALLLLAGAGRGAGAIPDRVRGPHGQRVLPRAPAADVHPAGPQRVERIRGVPLLVLGGGLTNLRRATTSSGRPHQPAIRRIGRGVRLSGPRRRPHSPEILPGDGARHDAGRRLAAGRRRRCWSGWSGRGWAALPPCGFAGADVPLTLDHHRAPLPALSHNKGSGDRRARPRDSGEHLIPVAPPAAEARALSGVTGRAADRGGRGGRSPPQRENPGRVGGSEPRAARARPGWGCGGAAPHGRHAPDFESRVSRRPAPRRCGAGWRRSSPRSGPRRRRGGAGRESRRWGW